MRIAVAAEGTRGDIYPMLDLAGTFFAAGHEVIICAPPEFRAVTTERRMDFYPIGDDFGQFLKSHASVLAGGGIQALRVLQAWLRSSMAH